LLLLVLFSLSGLQEILTTQVDSTMSFAAKVYKLHSAVEDIKERYKLWKRQRGEQVEASLNDDEKKKSAMGPSLASPCLCVCLSVSLSVCL
jgi:hypothetical protein